ncbi:hypothetical protein KFZ76_12430 [Methylovulum psychrotolerans]|uniref:hypothetical protein n=1 Tax=Methylovulum psychrotolerans TaxID=1704499 RepID=UPI001BFF1C6D|nr:hypothetical protein [Methylovulum psychrotolerans]MBT9098507.1 hypothetical protein [Methylovulum psychrotolerans]
MKSNINLCVLPECYLDTNLLETLVPPDRIGSTRGYNHKHSCNKVVDDMLGRLQDDFAVGIVDKDRRPLERTAQFVNLDERHGLRLCKDPNKNHYLIFHPPIEQWLLDEAKQVGIALDADPYWLPTTLKGLLQETKHEHSKHDKRFKCLFRDLKAADAPGINLLAKWLEHLKSNPYKTDINTLQNL